MRSGADGGVDLGSPADDVLDDGLSLVEHRCEALYANSAKYSKG
jgi:hypothetical protein